MTGLAASPSATRQFLQAANVAPGAFQMALYKILGSGNAASAVDTGRTWMTITVEPQ